MDYKKKIEKLLSNLKSAGHTRGMIEERLGYSANAIDQGLARGGSEKMFKAIELYSDYVLKNATNANRGTNEGQSFRLEEAGQSYSFEGKGSRELLPVLVQLMETQNRILLRQEDELVGRLKRVETNLVYVAGKTQSLFYDVVSGRTTVLRSLSRLEKRKSENDLLNEADRIREDLAGAEDELYKSS